MAAAPRSETVLEGKVAAYHCWARCVRQAWLCGRDPHTGKNYDHRRRWIEEFAEQLAALVAIDVGFFAVMANHLHFLLRARPDLLGNWSDQEVARRYITLNRLVKSHDGRTIEEVTEAEVICATLDAEKVEEMRRKLAHVSTFMGALREHISLRANREEGHHGHFWDGRYKCRRLESAAAILTCAVYIDLNQIRAGEAATPEGSAHTSAGMRIAALQARAHRAAPQGQSRTAAGARTSADGWLCELAVNERSDAWHGPDRGSAGGRRASDKGILPLSMEKYLELLDWAGRTPPAGKPGVIAGDLAPILERLEIAVTPWNVAVHKFGQLFGRVVGTSQQLAEQAARAGRRWYRGVTACREVFG